MATTTKAKFKYDKEDIKNWITDQKTFLHIYGSPPSQPLFTFVNIVTEELKQELPGHPRSQLECFPYEERSGFVQCNLCFDLFVSFGSHLGKHIYIKHKLDVPDLLNNSAQAFASGPPLAVPSSSGMDGVRYRSIPEKMLTFIGLVKAIPQLWSPVHPDHNKKDLTQRNWELVVEVCREQGIWTDPNDARKNWKSLRDSYRRNLRQICEDGKDEESIKWKFFPYLKFLFDHKEELVKEDTLLEAINGVSPTTSRPGSAGPTKRSGVNLTEPDQPVIKQPKLEDYLQQHFGGLDFLINGNHTEPTVEENESTPEVEDPNEGGQDAVAEAQGPVRPDKFDAFGQWIAAALREVPNDESKRKIAQITALLLDIA